MAQTDSASRPCSRQPWGTIIKPDFGLGHQKLDDYQVSQMVERLSQVPEAKKASWDRPNKDMTQEEINEMLERLTKVDKKITDSDRRVTHSQYRNMGVVGSYAWKGF
ncbi:uncharacterized protein LOC121378342 [Gigantopelta aegis]|uniref:uncharacterized protein LOC121378342 n=1 Tax=Gigantopelta aegis TaxID=1735272 RepID=UPI001B888E9E|nr:uncharacterized protein LOC121378342 [Gigantopelta aegis]